MSSSTVATIVSGFVTDLGDIFTTNFPTIFQFGAILLGLFILWRLFRRMARTK